MQEANTEFCTLLNNLTQQLYQLKAMVKKLGKFIAKSRPYYEAFEECNAAQERCQEAAVQFQKAVGQFKNSTFDNVVNTLQS